VLAAFATDLMFVHLNGLHFFIANGETFLTLKADSCEKAQKGQKKPKGGVRRSVM